MRSLCIYSMAALVALFPKLPQFPVQETESFSGTIQATAEALLGSFPASCESHVSVRSE